MSSPEPSSPRPRPPGEVDKVGVVGPRGGATVFVEIPGSEREPLDNCWLLGNTGVNWVESTGGTVEFRTKSSICSFSLPPPLPTPFSVSDNE